MNAQSPPNPLADPASFIAMFVRRLPLYRGGGYIASRPLLKRLAAREPAVTWGKLRTGDRIHLNRTDLVGRTVFYYGDFSREVTGIAKRVLSRGDTMLDIGANIAETGLQCARFVGPEGQVHAFEPNPRIANLVESSAKANGFTNFTIHPIGLGDQDATLQLHIPAGNIGAGSLVRHGDDTAIDHVSVTVRPYSAFARENNIPTPRFVKIDVEGFEAPMIAGARDLWATQPPAVIIYEVNHTDDTLESHEATTSLRELGYGLYRIIRRWGPPKAERITDLTVSATAHGNDLLAIHQDADPKSILAKINR